ncbi:MAG: hypothetical protein SXA11_24860, partial [Cyanobacteriota bacterium]|nr:hypothetical protein [Cyanobacteriota bacterium]
MFEIGGEFAGKSLRLDLEVDLSATTIALWASILSFLRGLELLFLYRQEARGKRQEARGKRQEARGKRQEARGKRQEARGKRQEAR